MALGAALCAVLWLTSPSAASPPPAYFAFYGQSPPAATGYVDLACPPGLAPLGLAVSGLTPPSPATLPTRPVLGHGEVYVSPAVGGQGPTIIQSAGSIEWQLPLRAGATATLGLGLSVDNELAVLVQVPRAAPVVDFVDLADHRIHAVAVGVTGDHAALAEAGQDIAVAWLGATGGGIEVLGPKGAVLRSTALPVGTTAYALHVAPAGMQSVVLFAAGTRLVVYRIDAAGQVHGPYALRTAVPEPGATALTGGLLYLHGGRQAEMWSLAGRQARRLWQRTDATWRGLAWNGRDLIVGGSELEALDATTGRVLAAWDRAPRGSVWPLVAGPFGTAALSLPASAPASRAPAAATLRVFGPHHASLATYVLAPALGEALPPSIRLYRTAGGAAAFSTLFPQEVLGWPLPTSTCPDGTTPVAHAARGGAGG
jgi:hypothetical protein